MSRPPSSVVAPTNRIRFRSRSEPRPSAWTLRASIAVAAILGAIVDAAFARADIGPRVFADETGYLAIARLFAHAGNPIDMSRTASYSPGFAVFAALPSRLFRGDPAATYRAIVVVQIVLLAGASFLLGLLIHRLLRTGPLVTALAVLVASCLPSLVFNSGIAWSESFLSFTLVACLYLIHTLLVTSRRGASATVLAIAAGGAIGLLEVIHQRTTLLILVLALITVASLAVRGRPAHAVAVGAAGLVVVILGAVASRYATHQLWPGGVVSGSNEAMGNVTDPSKWKAFAEGAVGELWSLTVGSAGLAITGIVVGLGIGLRKAEPTGTKGVRGWLVELLDSDPRMLALLLIAPLVFVYPVSVLFISTGPRGDQFVYGRYVDVALPLVVAIGLVGLLKASGPIVKRLLLLVGVPLATLAGSFVVARAVGDKWLREPFNSLNTINILWYTRSGSLSLGEGTVVCCIALLLIGAVLVLRDLLTRSGTSLRTAVDWATSLVVAGIVLGVFALHLHQIPKLNDLLDQGVRDPKAISRAIHDRGISHVVIDPGVAVQDRLAIQYWTPELHLTTATSQPCAVIVAQSAQPRSGSAEILAESGRLVLLGEECR